MFHICIKRGSHNEYSCSLAQYNLECNAKTNIKEVEISWLMWLKVKRKHMVLEQLSFGNEEELFSTLAEAGQEVLARETWR